MTRMEFVDNIAEKLKQDREALHISQDALALATGFSQQAISAWESGRRCPSLRAYQSLRQYLRRELRARGKAATL